MENSRTGSISELTAKDQKHLSTFSPSGNEIYYVTDNGKDNIGGKDIYFIKKVE